MAAYVISDVRTLDRQAMADYRAAAQAAIAKYNGRYVVRGGAIARVEGDWTPEQLIIVEFPSMQQAQEWYRSPEYAEALKFRQDALTRNLIFVEGLASD